MKYLNVETPDYDYLTKKTSSRYADEFVEGYLQYGWELEYRRTYLFGQRVELQFRRAKGLGHQAEVAREQTEFEGEMAEMITFDSTESSLKRYTMAIAMIIVSAVVASASVALMAFTMVAASMMILAKYIAVGIHAVVERIRGNRNRAY